MTDGDEITDVLVFDGDVPALPSTPPKTPAREKRMCACYRRPTPLQLVWGGGGSGGDASPALPRRKNNRQSASRLLLLPLCGKGGGAGAGPSGVKKKKRKFVEEEAKGRLGRGRASWTRNEAGSARMGLVSLFIQCTHGRLLTSLGIV